LSSDAAPDPVVIRFPMHWGEMDAMGHANNAVYFRWFESGRLAYFERIGWPALRRRTGIGPILRSTEARFRAPLVWPDEIEVGTRVTELSTDRFTMRYEVRSERLGRVAAEGFGVIVAYDYHALTKAVLPEDVVAGIRALEPGLEPGDAR
jgi:acyl-CoA thioester hydrolase